MRLYDPLLYPFSLLYDGITRLRNRMFNLGRKKSVSFEVPVVVVGNLSLGGTGKTPMVEFFVKNFKKEYRVATLSRGYGRKTTGFLMAHKGLSARDLGDEPFQIFQKFGTEVTVAVGEERILAIPQILADRPDTNLILLDDAFQHRYVKGDLNILLTTYQTPFFKDKILPLGTLREHPNGAKRADVIIVTKCPEALGHAAKQAYATEIRTYSGPDNLILFAGLKYGLPYPVFSKDESMGSRVILLSGIADNHVLKESINKKYSLLEVLEYPDHHKYQEKDLVHLLSVVKKYKDQLPVVLTTEKDAGKLKDDKFSKYLNEIPIFALPVEINFSPTDAEALLNLATRVIRNKNYACEI
jgi:tetraacyldisaccharide 4'-kinase